MKRKTNLAVVEEPQEIQTENQPAPDYDRIQKRLGRIALSIFDLTEEINNCLEEDKLYLISRESADNMINPLAEVFTEVLDARTDVINATRNDKQLTAKARLLASDVDWLSNQAQIGKKDTDVLQNAVKILYRLNKEGITACELEKEA